MVLKHLWIAYHSFRMCAFDVMSLADSTTTPSPAQGASRVAKISVRSSGSDKWGNPPWIKLYLIYASGAKYKQYSVVAWDDWWSRDWIQIQKRFESSSKCFSRGESQWDKIQKNKEPLVEIALVLWKKPPIGCKHTSISKRTTMASWENRRII